MRPSKYIACEAVHFPACFFSNERKLKQTPSYESMTRHEQLNRAYCTVYRQTRAPQTMIGLRELRHQLG